MTIQHDHIYAYSEEILIRNFSGDVGVEEIIRSWEDLLDKGMLTSVHKGVINHLGNCNLNMNPESFDVLMGYLKQNPVLKRLKLAVVCDSPRNIVFPLMAEDG